MTKMEALLFVFTWLLALGSPTLGTPNQCAMRGCGSGPAPCLYDGAPSPLQNETAVNVLREHCSNFQIDSSTAVCCSVDQVFQLGEQMAMLGALFKHCPSCMSNTGKTFCSMTCSPNQSDFVKVTSIKNGTENVVSSLSYYISEAFVTSDYASCEYVYLPSSNTKSMALACGSWGDDCSAHRWFHFMGHNPFSPIVIDFQYINGPTVEVGGQIFTVMNEPTTSCNQAAGPDSVACSCKDCPASC